MNNFYRHLSSKAAKWRPIIGLEVHAQINSKSKLFSRAGTSVSAPPNSQVAFFDCALPGTLPVVNRRCVEAAVLTGLALNCKINSPTTFDRKHYFYSDLPSGYQITQYFNPIASSGILDYQMAESKFSCLEKSIRIKQIQLEQDSGKSLHDTDETLIDLNRCGMGLLEIVTEPDFFSADEVVSFLKEIQLILSLLKVCSGKLEEGAMRVDANVSIQHIGEAFKGVRTEVKNLNSIKSVQRAIQFEISRQIADLNRGKSIVNETRSFDAQKGCTQSLRDKERVFDYRYMPEPNLPPLRLFTNSTWPGPPYINIDLLKQELPSKLPNDIRKEYATQLGLRKDLAIRFVGDQNLLKLFDECINFRPHINATTLANFILIEIVGFANAKNISDICLLPADHVADFVLLRFNNRLSSYSMRLIMEEVLLQPKGRSVEEIVRGHNLEQVNDPKVVEVECQRIFDSLADAVAVQQRKKNGRPLPLLMGKLMKETRGTVNPKMADETFKKLLASSLCS